MDEGTVVLYLMARRVHIACAIISGSGLLLRMGLRLWAPALLAQRPLKILPHLVDTLLLASALLLAGLLGQYPLVDGWLTAKVLALLVYIMCGAFALRGGSAPRRLFGAVGAMASFAFIVSVALSRNPAGYFAPLLESLS